MLETLKRWKFKNYGKLEKLKNYKKWKTSRTEKSHKDMEKWKSEKLRNPKTWKSWKSWKIKKPLKNFKKPENIKNFKNVNFKKINAVDFSKNAASTLQKSAPHFLRFWRRTKKLRLNFQRNFEFSKKTWGIFEILFKIWETLKNWKRLVSNFVLAFEKKKRIFFFFWILKCRFFWKCRLFSIFSQPKKTALKKTEKCRKKWRIQKEGPFFKAI